MWWSRAYGAKGRDDEPARSSQLHSLHAAVESSPIMRDEPREDLAKRGLDHHGKLDFCLDRDKKLGVLGVVGVLGVLGVWEVLLCGVS